MISNTENLIRHQSRQCMMTHCCKLVDEIRKKDEIIEKMKNCQNCEYGDRFANVDPCKECHQEGMYINWKLEIKK